MPYEYAHDRTVLYKFNIIFYARDHPSLKSGTLVIIMVNRIFVILLWIVYSNSSNSIFVHSIKTQ